MIGFNIVGDSGILFRLWRLCYWFLRFFSGFRVVVSGILEFLIDFGFSRFLGFLGGMIVAGSLLGLLLGYRMVAWWRLGVFVGICFLGLLVGSSIVLFSYVF